MHEETVMQYIRRLHPDWFDQPPMTENCPFSRYAELIHNRESFKTVHMHGCTFAMGKKNRGLACLWVKELRENAMRVLGEDRMRGIFGDLDVPSYSLYDISKMLQMNRDSDFEVLKCMK
jgi:hypothetical protein